MKSPERIEKSRHTCLFKNKFFKILFKFLNIHCQKIFHHVATRSSSLYSSSLLLTTKYYFMIQTHSFFFLWGTDELWQDMVQWRCFLIIHLVNVVFKETTQGLMLPQKPVVSNVVLQLLDGRNRKTLSNITATVWYLNYFMCPYMRMHLHSIDNICARRISEILLIRICCFSFC